MILTEVEKARLAALKAQEVRTDAENKEVADLEAKEAR